MCGVWEEKITCHDNRPPHSILICDILCCGKAPERSWVKVSFLICVDNGKNGTFDKDLIDVQEMSKCTFCDLEKPRQQT